MAPRHRWVAHVALAAALVPLATCTEIPTELREQLLVPEAAAVWLNRHAIPIDNLELTAGLNELEPLRGSFGAARVVGLGGPTYGTREAVLVSARIVRFLVERMGFTAIAIEGNWAEATRLDDYVRTGHGNLDELLSGMYYWALNTDVMRDLLLWLRAYNEAGGNVGVHGFDMQAPGMAYENVKAFVRAADPAAVAVYDARLDCMRYYMNGPNGRFPAGSYFSIGKGTQEACRTDLTWVHDEFVRRRIEFEARTTPAAQRRALQSIRIVLQFEATLAQRYNVDVAMAQNALWLLDELGSQGKMVLLGHNVHVSRHVGVMGNYLRAVLGSDYVNVGYSFGSGSFTALTANGLAVVGGHTTHTTSEMRPQSYPFYFSTHPAQQFLLDLRGLPAQSDSTSWIEGPRYLRSVLTSFDPLNPLRYWYETKLADEFDLIVHLRRTTPVRVLPFQYPAAF